MLTVSSLCTGGGFSPPFLPPPFFFEVTVKLQKFLDDSGMTSGELAREIGVTQKAVYYWLREGRSPRPHNIRAVSKATNGAVTATDWFDGE